MHLESLDYKYLTILIALLIELTQIIVLGILKIIPIFDMTNVRSSSLAFLIDITVYVRFGLFKGCLYKRASDESFNNICIYSSIFSVIIAENISVGMAKKISLR